MNRIDLTLWPGHMTSNYISTKYGWKDNPKKSFL